MMPLIVRLLSLSIIVSMTHSVSAEAITLYHADLGKIQGELQAISIDDITVKIDEKIEKLYLNSVIRIDLRKPLTSARNPRRFILLANGDRFVASPKSIEEDSLAVNWNGFENWQVPLEFIRAVALNFPKNIDDRRRATIEFLKLKPKSEDELVLTNGDRLRGTFVKSDESKVVVKTSAGETLVKVPDVRSLAFDSELMSAPNSHGFRMLVELIDGSRLTASSSASINLKEINCRTAYGALLKIPLSTVATIRVLDGRGVYLSDLRNGKYEFQPFLSKKWNYRNDLNVMGGWLSVRDHEYAKGLGMHSHSELSFKLDQEFKFFQSTVGIDDQTNGQGSVVFQVKVDNKLVWSSGSVRGTDRPKPTPRIDLTKKKRLTLIVDFDQCGDILDHANWCDALIVRAN